MIQWSSLESKGESKAPLAVSQTVPVKEDVHKYPSSAHYSRNWDKLVADVKKEEKDEKPEGDAALNKLFQQIYTDGSDEVKKAMNKSFVSDACTHKFTHMHAPPLQPHTHTHTHTARVWGDSVKHQLG